jgi:hypothetical protein
MSGNIRLYNTSGYVELQAPSSASAQVLELPTDSIKPALVHLHTETFSAQSTVSIDDVFSSTYDAYRIEMKTRRNASESSPTIRLRASGTDETGNYYFYHGVSNGSNSTGYNQAGNGAGYFICGRSGANGIGITSFDIMNPFLATGTSLVGQNVAVGTTTVFIEHFGGFQDRNTSYDGFTLADGGTLTGSIRIYGYRNS